MWVYTPLTPFLDKLPPSTQDDIMNARHPDYKVPVHDVGVKHKLIILPVTPNTTPFLKRVCAFIKAQASVRAMLIQNGVYTSRKTSLRVLANGAVREAGLDGTVVTLQWSYTWEDVLDNVATFFAGAVQHFTRAHVVIAPTSGAVDDDGKPALPAADETPAETEATRRVWTDMADIAQFGFDTNHHPKVYGHTKPLRSMFELETGSVLAADDSISVVVWSADNAVMSKIEWGAWATLPSELLLRLLRTTPAVAMDTNALKRMDMIPFHTLLSDETHSCHKAEAATESIVFEAQCLWPFLETEPKPAPADADAPATTIVHGVSGDPVATSAVVQMDTASLDAHMVKALVAQPVHTVFTNALSPTKDIVSKATKKWLCDTRAWSSGIATCCPPTGLELVTRVPVDMVYLGLPFPEAVVWHRPSAASGGASTASPKDGIVWGFGGASTASPKDCIAWGFTRDPCATLSALFHTPPPAAVAVAGMAAEVLPGKGMDAAYARELQLAESMDTFLTRGRVDVDYLCTLRKRVWDVIPFAEVAGGAITRFPEGVCPLPASAGVLRTAISLHDYTPLNQTWLVDVHFAKEAYYMRPVHATPKFEFEQLFGAGMNGRRFSRDKWIKITPKVVAFEGRSHWV